MQIEVIEDKLCPGMWRVESMACDSDGEVYVTIFSGPLAEARAREYATWKQADLTSSACDAASAQNATSMSI
jgi:hypothetical protein